MMGGQRWSPPSKKDLQNTQLKPPSSSFTAQSQPMLLLLLRVTVLSGKHCTNNKSCSFSQNTLGEAHLASPHQPQMTNLNTLYTFIAPKVTCTSCTNVPVNHNVLWIICMKRLVLNTGKSATEKTGGQKWPTNCQSKHNHSG